MHKKDWLSLSAGVWHTIFKFLKPHSILHCMLTCTALEEYARSPALWPSVKLTDMVLSPACVRRVCVLMPRHVDLQWSGITDAQLKALLSDSTMLESLDLRGCRALASPLLHLATPRFKLASLNLNFAAALTDATLMYLHVHRVTLVELRVAETSITSAGVRQLLTVLNNLEILDLYNCADVTDDAFTTASITCPKLRELDVRGTKVTEKLLSSLGFCKYLNQVDFRGNAASGHLGFWSGVGALGGDGEGGLRV